MHHTLKLIYMPGESDYGYFASTIGTEKCGFKWLQ